MKKLMNKDGFTLIELMIVVVIIGILASIAIPQFLRYQLKSKTSEAPRNIGAIRVNEETFSAKWGQYVGAAWSPTTTPGSVKAPFGASLGFATMGFNTAGAVFYKYGAGATYAADNANTVILASGVVSAGINPTPGTDLLIHAIGNLDNDATEGIFFSTDEDLNVRGFPATTGESVF